MSSGVFAKFSKEAIMGIRKGPSLQEILESLVEGAKVVFSVKQTGNRKYQRFEVRVDSISADPSEIEEVGKRLNRWYLRGLIAKNGNFSDRQGFIALYGPGPRRNKGSAGHFVIVDYSEVISVIW